MEDKKGIQECRCRYRSRLQICGIDERAYQIDLLYKQNNWDQSRIQKEIRNLQSEIKMDLKKGELKCH